LGGAHIDCSTELEARYLKVWTYVGMDRVKMHEDQSYLDEIISDLEKLKEKNDEIVESYLDSIVDIRTQAKMRDLIWQEIMTS
jgi:hypothetical protein